MTKRFSEEMRFDYPDLTPDSVVIDGGCFEGNWANLLHEKYGCRIIAFEPVPEFFAQCAKRFDGHPKIRVHNVALGGHEGAVRLGVKGSMSGLYCDDTKEHAECWITTIPRVMELLGIERVALLKLNVEGAEIPILETLIGGSDIDRFDHIQVQPHSCAPDAEKRWPLIQRKLLETHEHVFEEPWCWSGYSL